MGEKQIEVDKRILRTQVRNFDCNIDIYGFIFTVLTYVYLLRINSDR